ncbi:MBL fold metallo-hydrolase [Rhodobacter sp. SGA-6-6]|uniref:MBL fold metallo-hydrolase n=1 Tax=Rhodobacter sp. SGA-6-6 TaxID=2710882 RepID=UPI0013EBE84F|nr:MBL fold metallo-hydrolase [Rhodobacter sp. SGA-6-6]NGM45564.1 MBL fold metallo-hydrolase [Rhodobacter sp. SGA-6-6]
MTPVFCNSAHVPAPEALLLKGGRLRQLRLRVRYGLLMHPSGPTLIDTGYTAHATAAPGRSAGLRLYRHLLRPDLIPQGQPEPFLARHGLRPEDIARVIVTHYHVDHISGLSLFPNARFTASRAAFQRLLTRSRWQNLHRATFPELLPPGFAERLDAIEDRPGGDLFGDGSVIALDLPGHADGHIGLLFPAARLLYGTDAQWLLAALESGRRPRGPMRLFAEDPAALAASTDLLHRFRAAGGTVMLCHDPAPAAFDEAP